MKIKHYFGLAVIAAMTASCSSNEDLGTAGSGTGTNEAGVGYATFTINLPSTNGTRADNPSYEQGTLDEYDVNDVTLLIFKKAGKSEGEYTFVEKAELGNMAPWKAEGSNGITASATITAKLDKVDLTGTDYYALAILNNTTATAGNKVKDPSTDQTYSDWNAAANAVAANFTDTSKGFYMANAPKFTSGEPTTLVKIDKVYATKQKAETNAATTIHVERGLAKVTVAALPTGKSPTGTKYTEDKVDITAWKLDVTNKSTFPIHKTAGLTEKFTTIWDNVTGTAPVTARFVDASNKAFSRVYWGVDPNYSDDLDEAACENAFNLLEPNAEIKGTAKEPQYCLENTFDIKHMLQGQTTRVVFKATYTPNGINKGDTFYKIGNSADLWSETDLVKQIKAKVVEVLGVEETDIIVDLKANKLNEAGTRLLTVNNVKIKDSSEAGSHAVSPANIDDINAKLGLKAAKGTDPIVGIATYKNGESYYIARIKHFGDAATPWNEGDATYGDNDDKNNNKYLGRYGVLRNNWYELTVGKVSGPGTPDIPTIKPTEPDDESYKYISVSVKILHWAKWSHTYDL
ncbi:Mfa1 family fimbria major subunit [Segatella copri]|uniref:Minor fimbrium subunit Mfa1 C-terminal domain-containing protein n=1 Tax=Segatella copri TaxID=165179 RepID=A0AA92WHB9_9BACT|nr:Mfa1 family fimbria major subunit [Segatella copri]RHA82863.1 hypothetical protein DW916_14160 [Segatella copri]